VLYPVGIARGAQTRRGSCRRRFESARSRIRLSATTTLDHTALRLGCGAEARIGYLSKQRLSRPSDHAAQHYRTPQIPASDGEIAAGFLVVEHMRLLGGVAHLFDRDRIEVGEKGFARPAYGRVDHPLKQHRV
jgi:hypothetical protein